MKNRSGSNVFLRLLVPVFGVFLVCLPLNAQSDALVKRLALQPDDTAKVFVLSDLCFEYRRKDADSAIRFGTEALELARRLHFPKGEAQALNDLAIIHIDRSAFAEADSALRTALRIRRRMGDKSGTGAIHNKLGNLYQAQLMLDEALEENRQALAIFERLGQRSKVALILSNIAILNFNLRQYDEALTDHAAAAKIHEALGDSAGLAVSLGNMANVLLATGDTLKALDLLQRAGGYFRAHGLLREYAVQAHNEAGVRLVQGDAPRATRLYSEALAIREEGGDRKAIASSLAGLADAMLAQRRTNEAFRTAHRSLALAHQVGATSEVMQAAKLLARIHARTGQADSTLVYHERYAALRDSVFSADMGKRMAVLQTRLGLERKEFEIQRQRADLGQKNLAIAELGRKAERRNFLLALATGGIGVLVLASLSALQWQKRRARSLKDAAVIAERENGLKAVLANTDAERKRIAAELHDGVGQQLTGLKYRLEDLGQSVEVNAPTMAPRWKDVLAIADEASRDVRGIAHRMMPRALGQLGLAPAVEDMLQKTLSSPGLRYRFEQFGMDERLPAELEVGVFRIAQELVGNILKHARATEVNVQLMRTKGNVVLLVEDDGVGFDAAQGSDGMGLQNMADRARVLHGTFTIENKTSGGTLATVRVPLTHTSETD